MSSRPFIPAPNVASVELIYVMTGVTAENVFHVRKGSPYGLGDLQQVRGLVQTWYGTNYKQWMGNQTSLTRIRTKALDAQIAPMEDWSVNPAIVGTRGGSVNVPNNVAFALKLATGLTGRSARGRWFAGGFNGVDAASNDVSSAIANGLVTALTNLISTLASNGHTFVICSYRNNKVWRTVAATFPVTSVLYTDLHVDSQRRRLTGRGQ